MPPVSDWSTTASSNTSVGGISVAENMTRANVNDAIRVMMAELRTAFNTEPYNVKRDGTAVGDGTTNDTAAFTAARSASGGRYHLPAGTYLVDASPDVWDDLFTAEEGANIKIGSTTYDVSNAFAGRVLLDSATSGYPKFKDAVTGNDIVEFAAGGLGGVPKADDLVDKKIAIIAGAIRQESPALVTITRSSTTATVTKTAHGYSNSDYVVIKGATQTEYNGYVQISNVTTNTFDYTVSGSPATPATGTPTAYKPSKWSFIADSEHTATGVVSVSVSGNNMTISYGDTYTKVISMIVAPDETLASFYNASVGGSIGVSSAVVNMGVSLAGSVRAYYNSGWQVTNTGVGTNNMLATVSDSGTDCTITHNYLPGSNIAVQAWYGVDGTVPYDPTVKSYSDASQTVVLNFKDTATSYASSVGTNWKFWLTKTYAGDIPLDGSGGSHQLNLYAGNLWFFGVMQA